MHDPNTIAFRFGPITIWHHDPCTNGTDDSCGWSSPKLTKKQLSTTRFYGDQEAKYPWFAARREMALSSPAEGECLLRGAFIMVANGLHLSITLDQATRWACEMLHNQIDNFRSSLVFVPGYHSNFEKDREEDRQHEARRFFHAIARFILRKKRPWYKHPRWHIHHWKICIRKPKWLIKKKHNNA